MKFTSKLKGEKHITECISSLFVFHRVPSGQIYLDGFLPPQVPEYSKACDCSTDTEEGDPAFCKDPLEIAFPKHGRKKFSRIVLNARGKRDIHFSDEPTDKDLNLFQRTLPLRKRHKRESRRISKANATYYCEERISKTKIGKLCAKIGINVQALVNVCSFDVEVKHLRF